MVVREWDAFNWDLRGNDWSRALTIRAGGWKEGTGHEAEVEGLRGQGGGWLIHVDTEVSQVTTEAEPERKTVIRRQSYKWWSGGNQEVGGNCTERATKRTFYWQELQRLMFQRVSLNRKDASHLTLLGRRWNWLLIDFSRFLKWSIYDSLNFHHDVDRKAFS